MGGIGVKVTAPGEVRDLWSRLRSRLGGLIRSKAGRDVLNFYLSFQADDGLEDGSWYRNGDSVYFFFGDAAGLCYLEMDLCHHWITMVAAELGMGSESLQELLDKSWESSFILKKGKIIRVSDPGPCHCEVCERYRPKEPSPSKPIPQPAALNSTPLQQARLHSDLKSAEPIVALDLCSPWGAKVKSSILTKLSGLPLKALNLRGQRCFSLPPQIYQCPQLEILGAEDTLNSKRARLSPELAQLQQLRGLDICLPAQEAEGLEIIGQLPNLEVLGGYWMIPQFPDRFADLRKLRHLNVSRQTNLQRLKHLPIESVVAWEPTPDWPIRFLCGKLWGDIHHLEFFEPSDGQPDQRLKGARNLRGLSLSNVRSLPDWLAELPRLEHLQITNYSVPFEYQEFKILEKLPHLRSLILRITVDYRQPPGLAELNFSRLDRLGWLSVPDFKTGGALPTGLERLQFLQIGEGDPDTGSTARRIFHDYNGWHCLHVYRAMSYPRSAPEWWLSRFSMPTHLMFEEFSRFYATV